MTFTFPVALAGLVVVALVAIVVVVLEMRRRRVAKAYAMPATLAFAVPRRLRWRRSLPTALLLLAVAILVLASARPHAEAVVPVPRATVVLVVDVSNSMNADDVEPTRLGAAQAAAAAFLDRLPPTFRVGAVVFSGAATVVAAPTEDREAVLRPLLELETSQGTLIGDAVDRAMDVLDRDARRSREAPATVVLLSDGRDTGSIVPPAEAAARAHAAGVPVHTIALGEAGDATSSGAPRPADREGLAALARAAGGEAFTAATDDTLASIYDGLASRLSVERRPVELTVLFTAAGTLLALVAAAASLLWLRRVP